MKIRETYRPELCACKNEERRNILSPYHDAERNVVVATDGRMMAVIPVKSSDPGAPGGYLSPEALAVARSEPGPKLDAARFPDWTKSIPPFNEGDAGTATLCLDAGLLLSLAKALGCRKRPQVTITFHISDPWQQPILVRPAQPLDNAFGVLMPVRDDDRRTFYSEAREAAGITKREPIPAATAAPQPETPRTPSSSEPEDAAI